MKHAIALLCLFGGVSVANAQVFQIHDLNTTVTFDLGPVAPMTQAGMVGWEVNGVNQLYQQWFWFRTSTMAQEMRINALPLLGAGTFNTTFVDPRDDTFAVSFGVPGGLLFDLRFSVQGSLPGDFRSDIAEQIRITNRSPEPIALSFFQYADLDLGGTVPDSFVAVTNPNAVVQADFFQGIWVSETVITPLANLSEVGIFPATLVKLDDGAPDVLNGNVGPLAGPNDYTWAWQWDFVLQPNQSFLISKDKNLIPAPGAGALIGLGLLALSRRRR
jgi:hypothetical protein